MSAILLVAAGTLAGSFLCSLFEAALYAITPAQVELHRKRRTFGAERLAQLRGAIEEPIAGLLTVNTIANTAGATWCGALVGEHFGAVYLGMAAAALTLGILFLSEILPKSLGVRYAARIGPYIAWPLQGMVWAVWPIVKIGRLLLWLLGRNRQQAFPTADEIVVMSRLAAQAGQLRAQEACWVENVLRLDQIRVYDLMTPRTVVYALPADLPLASVKERSEHWVHSRLPLTDDRDPDQIVGMVHRRDVFDALVRGQRQLTLRALMREIDFVPDTMRGHQLLDKLITEKKHMVAVIDEYGSFVGVVTLEDVLECLLGSEIVDEHDRHPDMQQWARSRAQQRQERTAPREAAHRATGEPSNAP